MVKKSISGYAIKKLSRGRNSTPRKARSAAKGFTSTLGRMLALPAARTATSKILVDPSTGQRFLVTEVMKRQNKGSYSEPRESKELAPQEAAKAYEPDARAKAVLRGKQRMQTELKAAGGTYTLDEVRQMLNGISRQAVHKKVQEGHLLTVPGPGDDRRYPTAQFHHDGRLIPGLKAVQEALPTRNPWAVFTFMVQPDSSLDGRKPIDVLKAGNVDIVVEAAKRYGEMGS